MSQTKTSSTGSKRTGSKTRTNSSSSTSTAQTSAPQRSASSKSTTKTSTPQRSRGTKNGKSRLAKLTESLPELTTGRGLATAAGVAVAAAAGVAAAKKLRGNGRSSKSKDLTTFRVTPNGDGWQIKVEGQDKPKSKFETKKEALEAARDLAHKEVPSQLVVHRQDGTVQDSYRYEE